MEGNFFIQGMENSHPEPPLPRQAFPAKNNSSMKKNEEEKQLPELEVGLQKMHT